MTLAARYNTRVAVQQPSETRGTTGEVVEGFTTVATRWAMVKPAGGSESFVSGTERVSRNTYDVRLRYESAFSGLTAKWRLVTGDGRILEVVGVPPRAANTRELVMVCDERI